MMNRVNGAQGVKLLECTNPVKGKWRVRWDVHNNEDGSADYMEAEFNGKLSEDTIKTMGVGMVQRPHERDHTFWLRVERHERVAL